MNKRLRDLALLNVGTLLVAVGVYFFKFPNHFSTGGVSGISIILGHYAPNLSAGTFVLIINAALLLLGFAFFGKGFGARTVYASLMYSVYIWIFERALPLPGPMTSQPLLELIFAVALPAVGSAMLFDVNASSGGTDIVAMVFRKYTHVHIGTALLYVDFLVTVFACIAFGMETGLFSMLGLFVKAFLVDMVMDNIRTYKVFNIVTDNPGPICDYVMKHLNHSATVLEAQGAYSQTHHKIVMAVVNRSQAIRLQKFVNDIDQHSFMTISTTSEIIGKGFRRVE